MNLKVFSVYDSKAAAYLQPFFSVNNAVALRSFAAAARDRSSDFSRHAADFTLFFIGDFDGVKGTLAPSETGPVALGTALEYASREDDEG